MKATGWFLSIWMMHPAFGKFDSKANYLPGSRHVEHFSNWEISEGQSTIMETTSTGFQRKSTGTMGDQIGGFVVINPSGVQYHFALPVYAYDEYQYSENMAISTGC